MKTLTPFNYQVHAYQFMLAREAAGLFLDMGLGKTVITLSVLNELKYNRFEIRKALIVAPKKVAENTWQAEQSTWQHLRLLRLSTVLGSPTQRIKALNTPADIYIINRDNVKWLVDHYRNDWPFDTLVIDESTSFKNPTSQRFKALRSVRPHIKRRYLLTGTPAPQGYVDLWAQLYLLDGGERLGATKGGYLARYFEPDQRSRDQVFSYKAKQGAQEAVRRAIGDICLTMKSEDYLELPDILYNDIHVQLTPKAQKAYQTLEKQLLLEVDETTIEANSAAILTNKLLQLCSGAIYDGERNVKHIHDCKLEALNEWIEALNGKSALIFYNFQHDRDRILTLLSKSKLRVRQLKTKTDEQDWNAKQIDVLLAHPASAAYGLNLQHGGHHVMWFGRIWSVEQYLQANKRLHRQGQTEKVIVHHLVVKGGMDEDVKAALEDRTETQEALIQALKARIEKVKQVHK